MNRTKRVLLVLMLLCALLLTACGEKNESGNGHKREPKASGTPTAAPTEEPTGSVTPTPEATPTMEPTPTPEATPTPAPISEMVSDMKPLFGIWVNERGEYVAFKQFGDYVDIFKGIWYSDMLDTVMPGSTTVDVLEVKGYSVKQDGGFVIDAVNALNTSVASRLWITKPANGQCEIMVSDEGKSVYKKAIEEYPYDVKFMDPQEFFHMYNGYWTLPNSYEFVYIYAMDNSYYFNNGVFYSEWAPSARIDTVVKSHDGETAFVYITWQEEDGSSDGSWLSVRQKNNSEIEIDPLSPYSVPITYQKGIPYPELQGMNDPDIGYVVSLNEVDALAVLRQYDIETLKEMWCNWIIISEDEYTTTFNDVYSGRSITVYANSDYMITNVSLH